MRTLSLICAILAAALSILAMFGVLYSAVLNRTDREALIGAYYLLFTATPVALITAALSLLNRVKWPKWRVQVSFGAFAFFAVTGVLWTIVNN